MPQVAATIGAANFCAAHAVAGIFYEIYGARLGVVETWPTAVRFELG